MEIDELIEGADMVRFI